MAEQLPTGVAAVPWSVYIVECADGSLYCGVAKDVARRLRDHSTARGAKYVRAHGGISKLLWTRLLPSQGAAMRAEFWIKSLPRHAKLKLVSGQMDLPGDFAG